MDIARIDLDKVRKFLLEADNTFLKDLFRNFIVADGGIELDMERVHAFVMVSAIPGVLEKVLEKVTVDTGAQKPKPTPKYNSKEVVKLRRYQNKSFSWLPHTGSYYGKNIKFDFNNNCGSFIVKDGAVTQDADGGHDYNKKFYFCGTDFHAGQPEWNNGLASVFTQVGCVATEVTIRFNK